MKRRRIISPMTQQNLDETDAENQIAAQEIADAEESLFEAGTPGVVVRGGRGLYIVQTDSGRIFPCKLRGNLKKNLTYPESASRARRVERVRKLKATDPIAIGDRVAVQTSNEGHEGVIVFVAPRRASLSRRSGNEREKQTLVANLEQAVIVFSIREPNLDPWKLDRFLVLAEDAEVKSLLVLNKADLAPPDETEAAAQSFRAIGYPVIAASRATGQGVDELRAALTGKISAFCGPSGVGKSSLLNAVQPGLQLKVGAVGETSFKGRHTTVQAELLSLSFGGWVADTPGLRQVEFWDLDKEDVAYCFPEMVPLLGLCKFADCQHRTEPGCAIREAVEKNEIQTRRYESYLEMTK